MSIEKLIQGARNFVSERSDIEDPLRVITGELHKQGVDPKVIADVLIHGADATYVHLAQQMSGIKLNYSEIAGVLDGGDANHQEIALALKEIGASVKDYDNCLYELGADISARAQILSGDCNYTEIVDHLDVDVGQLHIVVKALQDLGAKTPEVFSAFGANNFDVYIIAHALYDTGVSSENIGIALNGLGYKPKEIGDVLHETYEAEVDVVKGLRAAGLNYTDIAQHMIQESEVDKPSVANAFYGAGAEAYETGQALLSQDVPHNEVTDVLRNVYKLSFKGAATILFRLGAGEGTIQLALASVDCKTSAKIANQATNFDGQMALFATYIENSNEN